MAFNFKNFFTKIHDRYKSLRAWDLRSRNYHFILPPNGPSEEDLKLYREQLSDIKISGPVLILGVTPQLRDVLSDIFENVILADFSRIMHLSTLARMKPEVLSKETFIWTDWLNLAKALGPSAVELVAGDLVFTQISPDDREAFLNNIFKILKPGGFFVSRVKLHNSFWRSVSPYDIVHDLYERGESLTKFTLHRFGDKVLNEKNFSFRVNDFLPLFTEAFNVSRDIEERELILSSMDYFKKIDGNVVRSCFPKTCFNSWVSERFDIVKISHAGDYPESDFFPIYTLRKK